MSEPSSDRQAHGPLRRGWRWLTKQGEWWRLIGAVVLGIALGVVAFVVAYWWFENHSSNTGTYDIVRSAVAAVGVITVGAGATVALLRQKLNQDNAERAERAHVLAQDNLKLAQDNMTLTQASVEATLKKLSLEEDANRTDRYTKAVEQLGSDSIHVRLGGIYALKRLADDSERDLPAIVEVLAAFIRATTATTEVDDDEHNAALPDGEALRRTPPGTYTHAALTSLSRINTTTPTAIDLTGAYLPDANLRGADLHGATLTGANLTNVNLANANLTGAHLHGANLTNANLTRAHLHSANLAFATLMHAPLSEANLTNATLTNANLAHAHLTLANLTNATLGLANLTNAILTGANLTNANMAPTDLTGAHLHYATLTNANLTRAHLKGADLTHTGLHKITWEGTTWPDGFTPPPSYDPESCPPDAPRR